MNKEGIKVLARPILVLTCFYFLFFFNRAIWHSPINFVSSKKNRYHFSSFFLLSQTREIVSKTREKKQQTKILLVMFYCKEKRAACFGAIFLTGTVYTPCSQDFASTILKFLKHANSVCRLS